MDIQPHINCFVHLRFLRQTIFSSSLTQQQLGDLVEVSRKTINTIENGVFYPSTLLSLKLAKALNVKVEDIFWLSDATRSAESPEP